MLNVTLKINNISAVGLGELGPFGHRKHCTAARPWIPPTRSSLRSVSDLTKWFWVKRGVNCPLSRSATIVYPHEEDDGSNIDASEWGRAGWLNCAPWMTDTIRRPGMATWTYLKRQLGRISTRRMRMAWHRRYGQLITATWKLCDWLCRGGEYDLWDCAQNDKGP